MHQNACSPRCARSSAGLRADDLADPAFCRTSLFQCRPGKDYGRKKMFESRVGIIMARSTFPGFGNARTSSIIAICARSAALIRRDVMEYPAH